MDRHRPTSVRRGLPAQVRSGPRRRQPTQTRARETVRAILEAAAEVFGDLGYAEATTNKIATRAGVSIGSLYQYFPNKAAIVERLLERHHEEVNEVVDVGLARLGDPSIPLHEALTALMEDIADLHAADPKLHRFLGRVGHVVERPDRSHESGRFVDAVASILEAREDVSVDDARLSALLVCRALESLARWLVHEAPPQLETRRFVDESVAMFVGYLRGPSVP